MTQRMTFEEAERAYVVQLGRVASAADHADRAGLPLPPTLGAALHVLRQMRDGTVGRVIMTDAGKDGQQS